ncbi:hypothetical protein AKJ16_DCAP11128 [Drosera capensis]
MIISWCQLVLARKEIGLTVCFHGKNITISLVIKETFADVALGFWPKDLMIVVPTPFMEQVCNPVELGVLLSEKIITCPGAIRKSSFLSMKDRLHALVALVKPVAGDMIMLNVLF